jgi:hypothetical protein
LRAAWALLLLAGAAHVAAAADPELPSPEPNYTKAYIAAGAGIALTGLSFWLAEEADRAYQDYETGSDPDGIQSDYDRTVRLDKLSAATLIVGQAGIALGIYWRFLSKPKGTALAAPSPRSSPRFEPLLYPGGVAVRFRF